jgi:uncharacterized protein (DUF2062 family)
MRRLFQWFRNKVITIAKLDSTPVKIAIGVGVGAFIAMFPITGFQFLSGILLSFILRINKIAVVVTTQVLCNPLTLPFLFFLDYKVGERILGYDTSMTLEAFRMLIREMSLRNAFTVFTTIAKPLYLGSAITAPFAGLIAFAVGFLLIRRFRRREARKARCFT